MSDAKVTFFAFDKDDVPGNEQMFEFACPKNASHRCGALVIAGKTDLKRDPNGQNGGIAQWDWDGNLESPTFSPSVNCLRCWHGYIRNGRCVDTNGQDEPEPSAPVKAAE